MGSGVVSVGRRPYAVGLYWENSPSSRVVAAAKEAASQPGQHADFYAIRAGQKDGRVPQFGLGQSEAGHKAGMPAFAGCLANQQLGSWVGAFRLREGTVVTVVRDDLIVPDGDQLYLDETEARERLLQEVSFGGLQRIYAPEAWAIPGADNMPISLLLDERRDVKLQPVRTPKSIKVFGAGVLILLILGLGAALYMENENEKRAALEAEKINALSRARSMMGNEEPHYPPPERKWESRPNPMELIEVCRAGLAKIPGGVGNWHSKQLRCDGNAIAADFGRGKGNSAPPKNWVIDPTGSTATLTVPLQKPAARGHQDLVNPDEVTRKYLAQDWSGEVARMPDDPPPPPPPDYKGTWNPPPPPWVKRSFTLSVPQLPSLLTTYFSDLPGVVIDAMEFAPGSRNSLDGTWTVRGVIYENRI